MWRRDLGLVERDDHAEHTDRESSDGSTGDQHSDVDGGGLNRATDDGDQGAELDRAFTAERVGACAGDDGADCERENGALECERQGRERASCAVFSQKAPPANTLTIAPVTLSLG